MANFVEPLKAYTKTETQVLQAWMQSFWPLNSTRQKWLEVSICCCLGKEKINLSAWFFQPSFLSDPRGILNHLFLKDLSFSSEVPSSPRFSTFVSSPVDLLLLPLLIALAPMWFADFEIVNEACMPSRCLRSSSTWVSKSSEIHRERENNGMEYL